MKHLFFLLLVTTSITLCACSIRPGYTHYQILPLKTAAAIDGSGGLYIAMPADFQKGNSVEKDSGAKTQKALQKAIASARGNRVLAAASQGQQATLAAAQTAGCALLIDMRIVDWSDPPASFQISPDRGEVVLSIYETETGSLLRSDSISCKGSATTINLIGAYSPADCLEAAFEEWSSKFFKITADPSVNGL